MRCTETNAPEANDAAGCANTLFTALYDDLRRLARREVWRSGAYELLGTTSLVHEVWLHLKARPALDFADPNRFLTDRVFARLSCSGRRFRSPRNPFPLSGVNR